MIPYSLRTSADVGVLGQAYPLAFDTGLLNTISLTALGISGASPSVFNSTYWRASRAGTLESLSASVALNTIVAVTIGSTATYDFEVYRASSIDGSPSIPAFGLIASTSVSLAGLGVTGPLFGANSQAVSVPIAQGDLIAVIVRVRSLISVTVGLPALILSAGLSIA